MSNIYILEPPTSGKVLLKTTAGDIDVELWSKETPKTCRNFIQLCLEGYYNNTIFHRVVKDFIVQGGDPSGNGTGGESIYGEPFKDEFHQRLRFVRRGLLAMANAGKDDNGSQFFFTLGPTQELQNKHTIFGKVAGNTIYNMLKLAEGLVNDERPLYPYKIIKTEVLNNPFSDIVPRIIQTKVHEKKKEKKEKGVKDFKLLSFGEEAEEDEEITTKINEKYSSKAKSSHDVLNDPKLSSETELPSESKNLNDDDEYDEVKAKEQLESIKNKLKSKRKPTKVTPSVSKPKKLSDDDEEEDLEYYLNKDRDLDRQKKMLELKSEIKNIKKEYQHNKLKRKNEEKQEKTENESRSESIKAYNNEIDKYTVLKKSLPKKGSEREDFTLKMLEKFKSKLHSVKETENHDETGQTIKEEQQVEIEEKKDEDNVDKEETWLNHKLQFTESLVLAKDANTKGDDWFEIYDPRNPLNKRRRGEQPQIKK